ncbi:tyrosine-type recombinase/integrase [Dellaglioa algida]|uniref:Tyr recombinase domain-containing protein n=1 Tax=Dellaglioa algida TaxID=105612 RepID=A0A5C6MBD0_9LACO|nr:tyrosine-type recombinase/integrase [Dellaglioa algida]MDK1716422.1 tyrosine-type recombinase/integrase [Dellaglioa algida]MDK1720085.1 tyrosine-type recombinase/integrase [Dellaglioa algida]MDK1721364.1 tyrosine-type recombinase/integrase [Dellaglioa algida]MDK1723414.1 tyrosine-type recombinase/integrase [Dellaglioa algida]MDK1725048.1 tyrosine-type recombinase/integrase [Dellaglioa algida]
MTLLKELKDHSVNPSKNDAVFINQYETIPTSSAVNKTLKETLKMLNIDRPGFHFHSLRHTHVAYLLSHNIDLYLISKRLGHSDISTTSKVYSYLIDEYKIRGDNEIEGVLNKINESEKLESKYV